MRKERILRTDITELAPSLAKVELHRATISHLLSLHQVLQPSPPQSHERQKALVDLGHIFSQVGQTIATTNLASIDTQIGCALVAFAGQVRELYLSSETSTSGSGSTSSQNVARSIWDPDMLLSNPPIFELAQTFLNKKLSGFHASPQYQCVLAWSALVLGSYLANDLDVYLRRKGHIILVSLFCEMRNTGQHPLQFGDDAFDANGSWEVIRSVIRSGMGRCWHERLAADWKRSWIAAIIRQKSWQDQGLFKIGVPRTLTFDGRANGHDRIHVVEYLLYRDARDSLPMID